jgi:DNA-binding SARP family transcriptional activator
MGKLSLYLLGDLRIELDGKPLETIATEKTRALLVYLALEDGRAIRRDMLVELFWPERPKGVGRTSLRQAVANLRSALGDRNASSPFILTRRDHIQFSANDNVWIDSIAAQDLLKSVSDHRHQPRKSCRPCESKLNKAMDLYKGDFLAELSLPDSQGFSEWAIIQREAIHRQMTSALHLLVYLLEARGANEEACNQARKLIAHEPWSEANHRILMRLLAATGRRSQALRQFKACQRILRDEFGVTPANETMALYQQIKEGQIDGPDMASITVHTRQKKEPVRHRLQWLKYSIFVVGSAVLVLTIGFGLRGFSDLQDETMAESVTASASSSTICGEEAFDGNLQTQDPIFKRQEGSYAGWISLDPSTVVLPDSTTKVFATPLVLVVEDLSWVQIEGAAMHAGMANAWGCWYSRDLLEHVLGDAVQDLCMKQAGNQFAVLYRASSEGFEELGTTETIACP